MQRSRRFVRALPSLILAAAAAPLGAAWDPVAPAARRIVSEANLHWISPSPGARLAPGELVELKWAADPAVLARHGIEEWEVFLSLDGGWSYRVRITPHLDIRSTRFLWRVPHDLADAWSGEARVLLRFGDEREEHTFDPVISLDFAAPSPARAGSQSAVEAAFSRWSEQLGESARDGDPGVVWWQEGPRDGSRMVRRVARPAPRADWEASLVGYLVPHCVGPPGACVEPFDRLPTELGRIVESRHLARPLPRGPAVPVRLITHRFNE